MEINDDHIIALIKGQAATEQALGDLKGTVERGFIFMHNEQDDLEKRVRSVEKKVWYTGGIGTAIGTGLGIVVAWLRH